MGERVDEGADERVGKLPRVGVRVDERVGELPRVGERVSELPRVGGKTAKGRFVE